MLSCAFNLGIQSLFSQQALSVLVITEACCCPTDTLLLGFNIKGKKGRFIVQEDWKTCGLLLLVINPNRFRFMAKFVWHGLSQAEKLSAEQ